MEVARPLAGADAVAGVTIAGAGAASATAGLAKPTSLVALSMGTCPWVTRDIAVISPRFSWPGETELSRRLRFVTPALTGVSPALDRNGVQSSSSGVAGERGGGVPVTGEDANGESGAAFQRGMIAGWLAALADCNVRADGTVARMARFCRKTCCGCELASESTACSRSSAAICALLRLILWSLICS